MRKYSLNISFENTDLSTIYKAKQKIVLTKQHYSGSKLTWTTFSPFQYNTLDWTDDYAVYCSNSEISSGVKIRRLSDIDASPGMQYIFKNGYFSPDNNDSLYLSPSTYYIKNEMEGFEFLTFGLAQGIIINGREASNNPINAVTVPFMQNVSFMPSEVLEIYLENTIDDSIIVDTTCNKPLTLVFGEEASNINIKYNKSIGTFFVI